MFVLSFHVVSAFDDLLLADSGLSSLQGTEFSSLPGMELSWDQEMLPLTGDTTASLFDPDIYSEEFPLDEETSLQFSLAAIPEEYYTDPSGDVFGQTDSSIPIWTEEENSLLAQGLNEEFPDDPFLIASAGDGSDSFMVAEASEPEFEKNVPCGAHELGRFSYGVCGLGLGIWQSRVASSRRPVEEPEITWISGTPITLTKLVGRPAGQVETCTTHQALKGTPRESVLYCCERVQPSQQPTAFFHLGLNTGPQFAEYAGCLLFSDLLRHSARPFRA
jgi:hypothetical protein